MPRRVFLQCCFPLDPPTGRYSESGTGIYSGVYALLLCRVACGELFRVEDSEREARLEALRSGRYDAILADREASVGTYREFCV